jgi:hypothetical protein
MRAIFERTDARAWPAVVLLMLVLGGCSPPTKLVYEGQEGFHFVPPPGWVERVREEELPGRTSHKKQALPLPLLGGSGKQSERLLVRYDRISTGDHAWLRVTVADVAACQPAQTCRSLRLPGSGWKRESQEDSLEVSGLPAARLAFQGRCYDQDYLCETTVVCKGEKAYLFAAALPASEGEAREQVRQAIAAATWE